MQLFTVKPPQREAGVADTEQPSHEKVDQHLKIRVPVTAGPHDVGVAFPKKPSVLLETPRQPYQAHFNYYRHPRIQPAVYSVSIVGPFARDRTWRHAEPAPHLRRAPVAAAHAAPPAPLKTTGRPADPGDADAPRLSASGDRCGSAGAARVLSEGARASDGFDAGIEMALSAVLVSPEFLFRVERDPAGIPPNTAYRVSDLELASRLSFFLWSSIPDDELLRRGGGGNAARAGGARAAGPAHAGRRAIAGARDQLRRRSGCTCANLDSITPDMRLFPDFDDNLRQAFRQETELFFDSVLREDRSVLDLLQRQLHLPQRAAGEALRHPERLRQPLPPRRRSIADSRRGGLLRQGSILTVTSYATRTSPVLRGKWILDNLLGVPPPPPLPNVPALKDNTVDGQPVGARAAGRAPRATRPARRVTT